MLPLLGLLLLLVSSFSEFAEKCSVEEFSEYTILIIRKMSFPSVEPVSCSTCKSHKKCASFKTLYFPSTLDP